MGAYIVVRRIVFVSGGITHASFGGIGLGIYLGINPILSAAGAAILAAFSIGKLSRTEGIREDSAIASIWALGMALGVLFMTLTPGYATSLPAYLFGNILLVTTGDLIALALLAVLLIALFSVGYRQILYTAFDRDFARVRGMNVGLWERGLLILVAVSLVLTIRSVGIMLLLSLLTLPQTTIGLFTADFRKIICGSIVLCLIANVGGLLLSYYLISVPRCADHPPALPLPCPRQMSQRHHTTQSPARPRLSPRALGSLLLLLALLGACSRRVNTASSRTWQAFVTRYNVLYNAREAYQTTYQTALDGTTDDYTLRLPIDPVLARATIPGAAPRFSRTIEKATKAIEEHSISRKPARPAHWRQDPRAVRMQEKTEYNPALAEAWLLIARSQLYGGDLPAAHTTLTDILRRYATEPEVGDVARLYLCRLYTLRGELFDAEEELQHATRREGEVLRQAPLLYHTAAGRTCPCSWRRLHRPHAPHHPCSLGEERPTACPPFLPHRADPRGSGRARGRKGGFCPCGAHKPPTRP